MLNNLPDLETRVDLCTRNIIRQRLQKKSDNSKSGDNLSDGISHAQLIEKKVEALQRSDGMAGLRNLVKSVIPHEITIDHLRRPLRLR